MRAFNLEWCLVTLHGFFANVLKTKSLIKSLKVSDQWRAEV